MEAVQGQDGGNDDNDEGSEEEEEEEDDDEDEEMEDVENVAVQEPTEATPPGQAQLESENVAGPSTASPTDPPNQVEPGSSQYRDNPAQLGSDDEDDSALSPVSGSRPLSRSPPASRHASQSPQLSRSRSRSPSLVEQTAGLSLSQARQDRDMHERVAGEVAKQRARQQKKYHSKRASQRAGGRQKGSKAKQDTRVTVDRSGIWE